ncbi:MAG TPA: threonine--tRNA ligase, partial [Deltaproteobacteria bacterium]|nr:threonine--tRNA ligase [Deltaproteobacteria bacterium]
MPQITVTVDGKEITTDGSIIKDIIRNNRIIAARVNGNTVDLAFPLADGLAIETIDMDSEEGVHIIRHSTSHIMAEAVKMLFPDAKPTIGPSTEDGFYYDFDRDETFSSEDLEKIEKKMEELVKQDAPFVRKELGREEAISFFKEKGEPYKVEIINDLGDETCSPSSPRSLMISTLYG